MTGPEHYRQAERHIRLANEVTTADGSDERYHLAAAQVHATLALAAATIAGRRTQPTWGDDGHELDGGSLSWVADDGWTEVC